MSFTPIIFSAVEKNRLKRFSVRAVILFGSHAQGLSHPQSDYDFGILLGKHPFLHDPQKRREIYDVLYDILSEKIRKLVNIDIVFLQNASAELQAHVMKYGIPVFEADKNAFADFKEEVMICYSDFAPLRALFHEGILSRID